MSDPSRAGARPFFRTLGRTGLTVSAFGLGGGTGISSADALYAYDRGVNFFFYSADLHHFRYGNMAEALRRLCGTSSSERSKIVLAAVTYINRPHLLTGVLFDQIQELGIDYIDVLFWGYICDQDRRTLKDCLDYTRIVRGPNAALARYAEQAHGASENLKKFGIVRYVGASFHSVDVAREWVSHDALDVMMHRYNVAHRAAAPLFDALGSPDGGRQGIVTFKTMCGTKGPLWHAPAGYAVGAPLPDPATLYRYPLSHPSVDVCLAAWENRREIDQAFDAAALGPLCAEDIRYLEQYGDLHAGRTPIGGAGGPTARPSAVMV